MNLLDQANEIAALIKDNCTFATVYPTIPSQVEAFCAVVSPAPQWGSFESASFCGPSVSWEIILCASLADFGASMGWFFARIVELEAVADLGVASWSQPERINLGGGDGLAVRVQLSPRTLEVT